MKKIDEDEDKTEKKKYNGKANLTPIRDRETAQAKGKRGGLRSVEARRERKRMSQIYGEFLVSKYKIEREGRLLEMTGMELVAGTIGEIMARGDSASVSMMKEMREATEGIRAQLEVDNKLEVVVKVDPHGV